MWFRVIGILIVVVVGLLILSSLRSPHSSGPDANGWYEARPIYGLVGSGFAMEVASRQAATAPDGTALVVLQVGFRNQGHTQFTAQPADFQFLAPDGGIEPAVFSAAACPHWRQPVAPGGLSRPLPLCFPGAQPAQALTLLWTPNVAPGPLGTETRLDIPAQPVGEVRPSRSIPA